MASSIGSRKQLLLILYQLCNGTVNKPVYFDKISEACEEINLYQNADDLKSDLFVIEDQGLIKQQLFDDVGVFALSMTPKAITIIESEKANPNAPDIQNRIYTIGKVYDFDRDLKRILRSAKIAIFIIDPYADEEIFDNYATCIVENIQFRLLTKKPKQSFQTVIKKFNIQYGALFSCRSTDGIHDRILIIDNINTYFMGQSIKDAAKKYPTYINKSASNDNVKIYEDIWEKSEIII